MAENYIIDLSDKRNLSDHQTTAETLRRNSDLGAPSNRSAWWKFGGAKPLKQTPEIPQQPTEQQQQQQNVTSETPRQSPQSSASHLLLSQKQNEDVSQLVNIGKRLYSYIALCNV